MIKLPKLLWNKIGWTKVSICNFKKVKFKKKRFKRGVNQDRILTRVSLKMYLFPYLILCTISSPTLTNWDLWSLCCARVECWTIASPKKLLLLQSILYRDWSGSPQFFPKEGIGFLKWAVFGSELQFIKFWCIINGTGNKTKLVYCSVYFLLKIVLYICFI